MPSLSGKFKRDIAVIVYLFKFEGHITKQRYPMAVGRVFDAIIRPCPLMHFQESGASSCAWQFP